MQPNSANYPFERDIRAIEAQPRGTSHGVSTKSKPRTNRVRTNPDQISEVCLPRERRINVGLGIERMRLLITYSADSEEEISHVTFWPLSLCLL